VNGTWNIIGPKAPAGPVNPGKGYKAQNNTQSIFTDQDTINRFQTELIAEHVVATKAAAKNPAPAPASPPSQKKPAQTHGRR
jgi:hypothetical protein